MTMPIVTTLVWGSLAPAAAAGSGRWGVTGTACFAPLAAEATVLLVILRCSRLAMTGTKGGLLAKSGQAACTKLCAILPGVADELADQAQQRRCNRGAVRRGLTKAAPLRSAVVGRYIILRLGPLRCAWLLLC